LSKILSDFAISALAYFFIGYWIAYGINFLEPAAVLTENHGYGLVKFFFLLTFAAAIPAIISGGIAERAKFGPQLCATAWTRKLRPGAGLLRKDAQPQIVGAAPRREPGGVGFESFAPRRGSYVWTRPHCQTCFSTLLPGCIYVSGLFEEAVISFWPTLCELAVCLLHSDLEGQ
jgi:hypothetical protein